jgi:hypothetical protein
VSAGPLAQVLDAFTRPGVRSVAQISRVTGLDADVVEAAVDHLIRAERLVAEPLASGCPGGACGGCALWERGCAGPIKRPVGPHGRTLALVGAPEPD